MKRPPLDKRLVGAAQYVRRGAYFADIGTDHAYLPVYLLEQGVISRAVASDIREGPLRNARSTVESAGFADAVTLKLTPGLEGLEGEGLTDIAICGMGGEMIISILEAAPFVRDPAIRLILQPMSRWAPLRRYLTSEGFTIEEESISVSHGKVYTCLCVHYSGEVTTLTPLEAELGKWNIAHRLDSPLFPRLLEELLTSARKQLEGRREGGLDTTEIQQLTEEMEKLI